MATETEQRQNVVEEARKWLCTPYHHQGRIRGVGVDCATLLCEVYQACGLIPYLDPRPYPRDWHLHKSDEKYLGWVEQYAHRVDSVDLGDVVIWRFGRVFSHGGIYIGDNRVIHSYIGQGCIISNMDETMLSARPSRFYSMWGK